MLATSIQSICIEAVRQGTRAGLAGGAASVHNKPDRSPVTTADMAVQAVISFVLFTALPHVPLIAEEDAKTFWALSEEDRKQVVDRCAAVCPQLNDQDQIARFIDRGATQQCTPPMFVLDPIDGTKGFIRGGQWCCCLGFVEADGTASLGILGCPNLPESFTNENSNKGFLFEAITGHGARIRPLFPRDAQEAEVILKDITHRPNGPKPKRIVFTESFEKGHTVLDLHAELFAMFEVNEKTDVLRMDSQCKYAVLARGDAHVYPRITKSDQCIWDLLPGTVILQEAGGLVTEASGAPLNFLAGRTVKCTSIVSTGPGMGEVHQRVLDHLKNREKRE